MTEFAPQSNGHPLLAQPHGGALIPPPRPGEIRNPWGRYGKAGERPVTEAIAEVVLGKGGSALEIAKALSDVAKDKGHPAMVQAAREILNRLDGAVPKAHVHAHLAEPVQRRKVREVDYDVPEDARDATGDAAENSPD